MKRTRSGKDRTFGLSAKSAADFDDDGVAGEGHRGRGGLSRWLLGAAIALVAMAAGSAQATQYYYVSWTTGDDTTGDGSQGAPWKSISMAILSAPTGTQSDPVVIRVAAGTYLENPTFKKNWTTIAGGYDPASWARNIALYPTIVDGRQLRSVFAVEPSLSNLALDGVTMTNGSATEGGGLHAQSDITLTGCTIRNCRTTWGGGGILVASGVSLTMHNCTVTSNTAGGGGGIFISGNCTLTSCTISNNTGGDYGGGIEISAGTVTLTSCTVVGNTANINGGGIGLGFSTGTLTSCTLSGNTAGVSGGGIQFWYSSGTITNCTVIGNTAASGGGVNLTSSSGTLTNCTISNNAGVYGGGIAVYLGTATLSDCPVIGNSAVWNGGGVQVNSSIGTLTNCTITGNTTSGDSGGGIFFWASSAMLTSCTFSSNTANNAGGGIGLGFSTGTLTNCMVSSNTAASGSGGGIEFWYSSGTMTNCTASGNTAINGGGGGVDVSSGSCTLSGCTASGNTAYNGGGIQIQYSPGTITNCTVSGNTASGDLGGGGGVMILFGTGTMTNCTVSGNSAPGGGGINFGSSTGTMTNCTVTSNTVGSWGGGINFWSSTGTMTNCTVRGNTAGITGGGMNMSSSTGTLTNCMVSSNSAGVGGGGIQFWYSSGTMMTNCTVTSNTAGSYGGGICGHRYTLSRCMVVGNIAVGGTAGGVYGESPNLTNCLIWNNTGGGVRTLSGTIKHCTIFANPPTTSVEQGVGIRVEGSGAVIANNIIAGHNFGVYEANAWSDPGALRNNLFFNNPSGHYFDEGIAALNTSPEINILPGAADNRVGQDPLFYNGAAGDFHIRRASPCIDAGLNTISAIDDYAGNARPYGSAPDIGAYEYGYSLAPRVPANISPAHGATGVSLTPTLQSSAFSDPDPDDTHGASQWQISTANDFSGAPPIVWDTGRTTTALTTANVPGGVLTANTGYFWRMRHQDSAGSWSPWSQPTYFQTMATLNATISGRVTNLSTGAPIANATVQAFYGEPAQTLTNAQGNYSLQVMGDRWCTVTVTATGFNGQQQTAYVAVGATVTLNFALAPQLAGTISGRVVRAGTNTGISSATVTLEGGPSVLTDSAGYYSIGNVTPGYNKTLTAAASGFAPQQVTGITVYAGQTTVVNFSLVVTGSVTVQGHVTIGTSTLVIAAAEILVTPGSYRTFTNVSGFYSLSIPAGSGYMIRASAAGYSPMAQFPPPLISPNTYTYNFYLTREYLAPAAPTGLTATPGDQYVNLSWNANTESDLAGYNVYRLDYDTSPINAVLITGNSYQDLGLDNGTTYTYWVKAVDQDDIESLASAQVEATPYDAAPLPVSGLRATLLPFGIVVLQWNASPSVDAALYHIYSDNGSGTTITYGIDVLGSPVTSPTLIWVSQPLTIGRRYKFGVRVEDAQHHVEQNRSVVITVTPVDALSGSAKTYIVSPSAGMTVRGDGVSVYAEPVPGFEAGLAKVRFEVFYNGNWVDMVTHAHGNPDTQEPYFLLWDVTSLPDGPYEIRAVAIDVNSISDGTPMSIQVIVDNVQGEAAGAGSLIDAQEGSTQNPLRLREKRQLAHRNSPTQIVIGSAVKDQLTSLTIPVLALDRDTKVRVTLLDARLYRQFHELKVGLISNTIACAIDEFTEVAVESGQSVFAMPVKMTLPYADVDNDGWVDGYAIQESTLRPVLIDADGAVTHLPYTSDTLRNHFIVSLTKAGTIGLIAKLDINVAIASAVPTPGPGSVGWHRTGFSLSSQRTGEAAPGPGETGQAEATREASNILTGRWMIITTTWGTITWNRGLSGQPVNPFETGPQGTSTTAGQEFYLPGYRPYALYFKVGEQGAPILAEPGASLAGEGPVFVTVNMLTSGTGYVSGMYGYEVLLAQGPSFSLSVTAVGGRVVKSPDWRDYSSGRSVALNAVPVWQFDRWTGDVPSEHERHNPLLLLMDRNRVVTADFIRSTAARPSWIYYE